MYPFNKPLCRMTNDRRLEYCKPMASLYKHNGRVNAKRLWRMNLPSSGIPRNLFDKVRSQPDTPLTSWESKVPTQGNKA